MTPAAHVEVRIDPGAPPVLTPADLQALTQFVLRREGVAGSPTVDLVITDDATIQALHARFMGIDAPTDVLSFAVADEADGFPTGEPDELLGEVVVSFETAAAQAAQYGQTPAQEVRFLVVHGLLHLLGYDDADDEQRTRMLARQAELLADFDRQAGASA